MPAWTQYIDIDLVDLYLSAISSGIPRFTNNHQPKFNAEGLTENGFVLPDVSLQLRASFEGQIHYLKTHPIPPRPISATRLWLSGTHIIFLRRDIDFFLPENSSELGKETMKWAVEVAGV